MGFRPTLFTCIAHLLYYTLCLLYKSTHVYSITQEIQYNHSVFLTWYQSCCFDLFLAVLSLLVLLHSQHRFCHHNSCCSLLLLNLQRLPTVVFGFWTCSHCRWEVLHRIDHCTCHYHREYCTDYVSTGITEIVLRQSTLWSKPHSYRR